MKTHYILMLPLLVSFENCGQTEQSDSRDWNEKTVGIPCEGCDGALEFGDKHLTSIDTLPDFHDPGPKLEVSGTIYRSDGKTPAKDVILYIYHTDQAGEYPKKGDEDGWAKQHGYIRGWIRTNSDGKYRFYTLKPGAYPGGGNPSHIHPIIKEPGMKPYWIDEYLFEGDPYITEADRKRLPQRGGPGILRVETRNNGMLSVKRDIILGLNVPGYKGR